MSVVGDGTRFGLDTILQAEPFHDSISVWRKPRTSLTDQPTAVHEFVDAHDTPEKTFELASRFGLGTIFQLLPFHASTRVRLGARVSKPANPYVPTAWHERGETHDTPTKVEPSGPLLRLGPIDHLLPSHDSVSVCMRPCVSA